MQKKQFIADLTEMLEVDDPISTDTDLRALPEFDSLFIMGLVVYVDRHFSKKITGPQFSDIKTVADLIKLIGEEYFV
ncbi:MAG: acyl carrier protein [Lentisphaeria bacterium]|nr:acyl carrier protein [Lentisphaeria bacterium]